jgi:hypothetical protein
MKFKHAKKHENQKAKSKKGRAAHAGGPSCH